MNRRDSRTSFAPTPAKAAGRIGSKKETRKKMTETDDNNQPSKQKVSYLAIWSLALSMCAAICFLQAFIADWVDIRDLEGYVLGLAFICGALSFFLGLTALIQKRSLWWLSLVSFGICAGMGFLTVMWVLQGILAFLTM